MCRHFWKFFATQKMRVLSKQSIFSGGNIQLSIKEFNVNIKMVQWAEILIKFEQNTFRRYGAI